MSTIEDDYRQRIAVLKTLDIDLFISGMSDLDKARFHALPAHLQRDAALGAMHRARLKVPEMADSERVESHNWLYERGLLPK